MANLYDTILECETNDTLLNLLEPNKLVVESNSQFRYSRHNELVFESRNDTMHNDIIILSEKFPCEVFTAIYYEIEAYDETKIHYYRYTDGKVDFLGFVPKYNWTNHEYILKTIGRDDFSRLWSRIRKYLFRLDQTRESILDGELRVDNLDNHYDQSVTSYITISAECDNIKLSVEKTRNFNLYFKGYQRESVFDNWEEIYENLPF